MANTQFYREVRNHPDQIKWKDIFSDFAQKHTKEDMDFALMAGTAMDRVTEADMLEKWRKPWIFWRVLLALLAAAGLNQALMAVGEMLTGSVNTGSWIISQLLVPLIVPAVLMILFWELNIPRNLTLFELLAFFVAGGILSFFVTNLLSLVFPYDLPAYQGGPFREEPAKLAASCLLLYVYGRKGNRKIYGLTGLVIGAAVGTGFSIFESISYVLEYGGTEIGLVRMVGAFTGHTIYTAPYAAAMALHMKGNRFQKETFLNRDFALTFLGALGMHMLWNSGLLSWPFEGIGIRISTSLSATLAQSVIAIPVMWSIMLWMVRKCLRQAVLAGRSGQSHPEPKKPEVFREEPLYGHWSGVLECIQGADQGRTWQLEPQEQELTVGTHSGNPIVLSRAPGVSRSHCSVQVIDHGLTLIVRDLNSSYGTYLATGERLKPGVDQKLRSGDIFYLGSRKTAVRYKAR